MATKNRIQETMTMMADRQYIRFDGNENLMFFKTKRGMMCSDIQFMINNEEYGRDFIKPSQKKLAAKMAGKKCELFAITKKFWFEVY